VEFSLRPRQALIAGQLAVDFFEIVEIAAMPTEERTNSARVTKYCGGWADSECASSLSRRFRYRYIVVIQEPGAPERRAMTMSSRTMINFSGKQWS
jgi:hypothetical protein